MILTCGEALIDFVPVPAPDGRQAYLPVPGGSPYNVAVALARLGGPSGFLGRVSTDFFGDMLVDTLHKNGVETRFVVRGPQPSTLGFVKIAEGVEPQYAFYVNDSADRSLVAADLPDTLDDAGVACLGFGSISLTMEPGATTIGTLVRREHGRRVLSLDPNIRPGLITDKPAFVRRLEDWVGLSTIVKVSQEDLIWLYPDTDPAGAAAAWRAKGPVLVVMTRGENGALALTADHRVEVPGVSVAVADTIGAGDTFHGGLLVALHNSGVLTAGAIAGISRTQLTEALAFATHAAAITCSRAGNDPPWLADLQ